MQMLCNLSPSRLKFPSLFSFFSTSQPPFFDSSFSRSPLHIHAHAPHHHSLPPRTPPPLPSSLSLSASPNSPPPRPPKTHLSISKKKLLRNSPENQLRRELDVCSKNGDLVEALRLYETALSAATPLSQHHYNVLLYLCSSSSSSDLGLRRGFEILHQMTAAGVPPNEATFTSAARIAAALDDPDMAFDLVKQMAASSIPPRLRSYGPALFGFCARCELEKAFDVDAHMVAAGVAAEEPELAALLGVSSEAGSGDRVYRLMHRMRKAVRRVSEATAGIVEGWFRSEAAAEAGEAAWDTEKVREGVVKGGGGWHGQGWLGKGNWRVVRARIDESGVCGSCRDRLVCIDIDPKETENFASSMASLACRKEVNADFTSFQGVSVWI